MPETDQVSISSGDSLDRSISNFHHPLIVHLEFTWLFARGCKGPGSQVNSLSIQSNGENG